MVWGAKEISKGRLPNGNALRAVQRTEGSSAEPPMSKQLKPSELL